MRALVYTAPRCVEMREWPRPRLDDGEIEIAVAAAGICGADISGFLGRSRRRNPPLILGHELVGLTADGRRVVADPLMGCGRCAECRGGREESLSRPAAAGDGSDWPDALRSLWLFLSRMCTRFRMT